MADDYLQGLRRVRQLIAKEKKEIAIRNAAEQKKRQKALGQIGQSLIQNTVALVANLHVSMPALGTAKPQSSPMNKALSSSVVRRHCKKIIDLPKISNSASAAEFTQRLRKSRIDQKLQKSVMKGPKMADLLSKPIAAEEKVGGWKKVKKAVAAASISRALRVGGQRYADRRWSQSRRDFYQEELATHNPKDADLTPRRKYNILCRDNNVLPDARLIVPKTSDTHHFNFGQFQASPQKFLLAIEAIVKTHPHSMHVVDISHNSFSDRTITELLWMCMDDLSSADFSHNQIGAATCHATHAMLTDHMCQLKELNLSDIEGAGIGPECLHLIAEGVRANKTLRRLKLRRTKLDDAGAYALAAAMSESRQCCVTDLDVSCNAIREAAGALIECKGLENLNISDNRLADKSFEAIAHELSTNTTLLHLDMSGIDWSFERAKELSEKLCDNNTLLGFHIKHFHRRDVHNMFTCTITAQGFLLVEPSVHFLPKSGQERDPSDATHSYRTEREWLRTPHVLRSKRLHEHPGDASIRGCWLCGGWTERKFVLTAAQPPTWPRSSAKVNIHLHIDQSSARGTDQSTDKQQQQQQQPQPVAAASLADLNWPATRMNCAWNRPEGKAPSYFFETYRVLPPGQVYFYFSSPAIEKGEPFVVDADSVVRKQLVPVPDTHWLKLLCKAVPVRRLLTKQEAIEAAKRSKQTQNAVLSQLHQQMEELTPAQKRRQKRHRKREIEKAKTDPEPRQEFKPKVKPKLTLNYVDTVATNLAFCNTTAVPRPHGLTPFRPKWNLKRSVFAPRADEWHSHTFVNSKRLQKQAFEVDWKKMDIKNVFRHSLKGEEGELEVKRLKQYIGERYERLVVIFRDQAANSAKKVTMDSALYCWSWLKFIRFTKACRIFHSSHCNNADLDIIFIKANNNDKAMARKKGAQNQHKSSSRQLSRFEFMLCVILIANKRFRSLGNATKTLVEGLIIPHFDKLKSDDEWRVHHLYQRPISDFLLDYYDRLERIFRSHVSAHHSVVMSIKDWLKFVESIDILEEKQAVDGNSNIRQHADDEDDGAGGSEEDAADLNRDGLTLQHATLAFLKALMMVRDTDRSNAHKRMSMTDFLEGLCRLAVFKYRVADKLQPTHLRQLFANHVFKKKKSQSNTSRYK